MNKRLKELIIVSGILIAITILLQLIDADRQVARHVIMPDGKWPGLDRFPWDFLYNHAEVPGLILGCGGLLVHLAGYLLPSLKKFRKKSLFLALLLIIGPGLIVNVTFKDNLGRARPREIKEFGGRFEYTEIWQPGQAGENSSFPSGHASIAFYLLAPWFIYRKKEKRLARLWLAGGLAFGLLIGYTRIIQGGHFLSDVLWAGGFVYLAGLSLSWLIMLEE